MRIAIIAIVLGLCSTGVELMCPARTNANEQAITLKEGIDQRFNTMHNERISILDKDFIEKESYKYSVKPEEANKLQSTIIEWFGLSKNFQYQDTTVFNDAQHIERLYKLLMENQQLKTPMRAKDIDSIFE